MAALELDDVAIFLTLRRLKPVCLPCTRFTFPFQSLWQPLAVPRAGGGGAPPPVLDPVSFSYAQCVQKSGNFTWFWAVGNRSSNDAVKSILAADVLLLGSLIVKWARPCGVRTRGTRPPIRDAILLRHRRSSHRQGSLMNEAGDGGDSMGHFQTSQGVYDDGPLLTWYSPLRPVKGICCRCSPFANCNNKSNWCFILLLPTSWCVHLQGREGGKINDFLFCDRCGG